MKSKLYKIFALLFPIAFAIGCSSYDSDIAFVESKTGFLKINEIGLGTEITQQPLSREVNETTKGLLVNITDETNFDKSYLYGEMAEVIELPVGIYSITVNSDGSKADEKWGSPYYKGIINNIKIENNKVTLAPTIECSLSNYYVTVEFENDFKPSEAHVYITCNSETRNFALTDINSGRKGYFNSGRNLTVALNATVDGQTITNTCKVTVNNDTQHLSITYGYKRPSEGPSTVSLTLKAINVE